MIELLNGDCIEQMELIIDNSVDAVVTDPPYGLSFMGKHWDYDVPNVDVWREVYRVLKPGGYLLSFGGTRTYHRMACAIEDAGFEIRDMIEWLYGSGFPKSLDIGKAVDKLQGNERDVVETGNTIPDIRANNYSNSHDKARLPEVKTIGTSEWEGYGTALKPAHEPICMARKPLSEKTVAENVLKHGTGGINIDGCRVETTDNTSRTPTQTDGSITYGHSSVMGGNGSALGRFPANVIISYPENEYLCKDNLTNSEKDRLYKWLNENT